MGLSRKRLAEGDVAFALQLHSGAWWKVGAAAVLGNYVKDSALGERVRLLAEELSGDSRRFEELAGRVCSAGSGA